MNENKKAWMYLGVAILIVVGWKGAEACRSKESGPRNPSVEQSVPKPDEENSDKTAIEEPDGKGPSDEMNGNARLSRWSWYENPGLGFKVGLPAGWFVPASQDGDPHVYSCPRFECDMAFEVQRTDDLVEKGFDVVKAEAETEMLRPTEVKWLVKGARVLKSDAPGATDGWNDRYVLFFEKEHRAYTVFVNGWRVERLVFPTWKLLE